MNIKVEIINLRREGLSYNAIAQRLNINKDQVAKICKRNKDVIESDLVLCKECGCEFNSVKRVGRPQVFCSSKCRTKWWNKNHDSLSTYERYKHVCLVCGKEFISRGRVNSKYCSISCYRNRGGNHE